jgi:hypothetical protein|tara:strand:- start:163 stop:435 length:273 start_codon:yes stop_codon:yes gene_type:complete
MKQFMELLQSMLIPNSAGVYAMSESKKGLGFNCYDLNVATLDIQALNSLAIVQGLQVKEWKPKKFGDSHFLYVGPPTERKELDVTKFFKS